MGINLNEFKIQTDGKPVELQDYSVHNFESQVSAIFRNQKEFLIERISHYSFIVGCIAWLTDFDIIRALSKVDKVAIVLQKEDFLRPDTHRTDNWKRKLQEAYSSLKESDDRFLWPGLMGQLSVCVDPTIQPIRCVGNHNKDKNPAFPRMHNKFLVFGDYIEEKSGIELKLNEVWTGSYNFTTNAINSFENVVVIKNSEIAWAYYNEFCQMFALSEPLDWESDWCEPEFRIGT